MIQIDTVVEAVREDLLKRSQIGIKKYGVTLDRKDLSLKDWLEHAYQECLDQANYLKKSILTIQNQEAMLTNTIDDPKDLAAELAHSAVLETIEQHNTKFPNNMKDVYEETDVITEEHREVQYSEFAQAIFDERYSYYLNHVTKKRA